MTAILTGWTMARGGTGKRKHRKRREQRKFRPLSPGVSPAHSQPSTLGHAVPDARLPKVNSTGLWIGAPSLYSGSPSPAYFYGRPPGKGHRDDRPLHIPRAASETRIPQPMPLHPGAQRFYHSQQLAPVYEVPPTSGMEIYDVYQFSGGFGNGAPRSKLLETKHSPYYYNNNNNFSNHNHNLTGEFRLSSRLERSQSDAQERVSPRREGHRRQGSRQSNGSSSENRGRTGSRENLTSGSWASEEARRKRASKSLESLRENGAAVPVMPRAGSKGSAISKRDNRPPSTHSSSGAHVNAGFSSLETHTSAVSSKTKPAPTPVTSSTSAVSSPALPNGSAGVVSTFVTGSGKNSQRSDHSNSPSTPSITPSATDSMKLLAKNKTDDQKTSPVASIMVEKNEDDLGKPLNYTRYDYGGDIYTAPNKVIISQTDEDDYDNPIVNRMKEMVREKSRSNPTSPRAEVVNTTTSSSYGNGIYEEITTITKVTRSEVIESVEPGNDTSSKGGGEVSESGGVKGSAGGQNNVDLLDGLVLPDILGGDKDKKSQPLAPPSPGLSKSPSKAKLPPDVLPATTTPSTLTVEAAAASEVSETAAGTSNNGEPGVSSPTSPVARRPKEPLSPRPSDNAEDINKAGKRITASAFEFLEQYLSDDEGTEASHVDSPPLSPTGVRVVGDLVY
ncbi:hypothetical protein PoB_002888800 [Plakobranchus ocellatus]|uniref:Uncharacterized protein n=1 Tax=Plakobranchus ocellatus TaxID=259542 RepID=A0AAV4A6W1_9GAST|nr:hypothetical protein PoB_002888800 [Plakobranchus ocellatus]